MDVEHNKDRNKFFIQEGSAIAELNYNLSHDNKIDIYSTFVPEEARGKGFAALLAKAAFEYAQKENLKVIPSCSYIVTYMKRNKLEST